MIQNGYAAIPLYDFRWSGTLPYFYCTRVVPFRLARVLHWQPLQSNVLPSQASSSKISCGKRLQINVVKGFSRENVEWISSIMSMTAELPVNIIRIGLGFLIKEIWMKLWTTSQFWSTFQFSCHKQPFSQNLLKVHSFTSLELTATWCKQVRWICALSRCFSVSNTFDPRQSQMNKPPWNWNYLSRSLSSLDHIEHHIDHHLSSIYITSDKTTLIQPDLVANLVDVDVPRYMETKWNQHVCSEAVRLFDFVLT